jgi:glycosyltransferase involved in cell wall biosynthesis
LDEGIRLGIVGGGPDLERLETLARSLGVDGRVVFYGRIPDIADVWRLLAGCRIAVQPSSREGFGLFPLEAIALGRPLVFCDSADSAVDSIVRHGVEGLCTGADALDLSAALARLLADDALWSAMSAAASNRALSYDWPSVAAEIEAFMAAPVAG